MMTEFGFADIEMKGLLDRNFSDLKVACKQEILILLYLGIFVTAFITYLYC